jgi:hypothetical protein
VIVIARRDAPAEVPAAYLVRDGDAIGEAWSWRKGDARAKRIEAGSDTRLFGSKLTLEDFARFARVVFPGQVRRLPDAELDGRKVYVVETTPAPNAGSSYTKIVTSIDQETCTVLSRDSYDSGYFGGAKPRKTYRVAPADVVTQDGFSNAKRAEARDRRNGSTVRMEVQSLEIPAKVDESFFSAERLPDAGK